MSDDQKPIVKVVQGSFPTFTIMFLIFLTLKLCNVITWDWIWIFAPLWGPLALGLVIAIVVFGGIGGFALISSALQNRRRKKIARQTTQNWKR